MESFHHFCKAAPEGMCLLRQRCPSNCSYKYYLCGKGCTLGVLFEDSTRVYFEWLTEDGRAADYPPEIRYKSWSRRELSRYLQQGAWQPSVTGAGAALV